MIPSCPCATFPDETQNTRVRDFPELDGCLDRAGRELGLAVYYRCRVCGTFWEENLASAMHASVPMLVRSRLDDQGQPLALHIDLAAGTRTAGPRSG